MILFLVMQRALLVACCVACRVLPDQSEFRWAYLARNRDLRSIFVTEF